MLQSTLYGGRQGEFILDRDWDNVRIFSNNRELVSGHLISILENSPSFAYDFQRCKQEMTPVNFVGFAKYTKLSFFV